MKMMQLQSFATDLECLVQVGQYLLLEAQQPEAAIRLPSSNQLIYYVSCGTVVLMATFPKTKHNNK